MRLGDDRKNYAFVLDSLTSPTAGAPLFDRREVSSMASAHELLCAVSKIAGGVIVDSLPATAVLAGALAITALANGVLLLTSALLWIVSAAFWGLC